MSYQMFMKRVYQAGAASRQFVFRASVFFVELFLVYQHGAKRTRLQA